MSNPYPPGTKVVALINGISQQKTLGDYVSTEGNEHYHILDEYSERSSITSDIVRPDEIVKITE